MIDFWLAMYSHCEDRSVGKRLPDLYRDLLEMRIGILIGTDWSPTRLCSYLQGAVYFLDEDAEFRIHLWFDLPNGHPDYPQADRGMACIVQPVSPEGLYGPIVGQVAWLGAALPAGHPEPHPKDWIGVMIREQGYLSIEGAEWTEPIPSAEAAQLMAYMLSTHLNGMVSRRILEDALENDK